MAIIYASRRRHSLLHHLRRLMTTTSSGTGAGQSPDPQSPPTISVSAAKSRLRREFDPDKALSILSSLPSNPSPSSRFAFDLAVRRLARTRRLSDVQSLLRSRLLASSSSSHEPFISSLILSYGTAGMLDDALSLFEELPSLGSPRTVVSFNAILSACLKAKLPARVPAFFSDLRETLHSPRQDLLLHPHQVPLPLWQLRQSSGNPQGNGRQRPRDHSNHLHYCSRFSL
ncbi:hypothetical protein J5N97_021878 [Dioscorea zingiberensis]|uniref:Pentatricopeptide repeat-containing protein n=1 Tax=Dioscorea zingiberensis TaxID=325984 RepID=A0A9D5HA16_9LILI|nr:hypothetical protein J5N97_021878 [Dioscorea zingiberensis]